MKKEKYKFTDACILLFAKAPVPGQVKTRLLPALSEAAASNLHKRLIKWVFSRAKEAKLCPVQLWVSSAENQEFFLSLCNNKEIHVQQGEDLGERMGHAIACSLQQYRRVIVIGSDCPELDGGYLARAIESLSGDNQVVIGPALDGGYVLVGVAANGETRGFDPGLRAALFDRIEWGTSEVLEQTRQALLDGGYPWQELEPRRDIDRPEDLPFLGQMTDDR